MNPDPMYGSIYFDSCAFDGGSEEEQAASIKSKEIFEELGREIEILHSVAKEIEFPNTPDWVKKAALESIQTREIELEPSECFTLRSVEEIVVGNGSIEKMRSDCRHIFEAQKYGRYFVTNDKRILKKADEIKRAFTLYVVKPSEFLNTLEQYIQNKA